MGLFAAFTRPIDDPDGYTRQEGEAARLDRNFSELLQELRVVQNGVQILFAFLLTIAFTDRFSAATDHDRWIYAATLLLSATASGLLIAPVVYHRTLFRLGRKDLVVTTGHRLALAGIVLLAAAICGALILVFDVVFGWPAGLFAGLAMFLWFLMLWAVLPLAALRTVQAARRGSIRR